MIHVVPVDLAPLGVILPKDRVGMVVCQPYLELTANEPYCCKLNFKERQMAVIARTLEIAKGNHHGMDRTHFTIFPEYSICGLDGVNLVNTMVAAADWPNQTIVIGGVDGLSKAEYASLSAQPNTHVDVERNSAEQVQTHQWVNCQITWIKTQTGSVQKWVQPKIEPAKPEQDGTCQDMFHGRSAFVFQGQFQDAGEYRFTTLVCFDWIGIVNGTNIWKYIINGLQKQAHDARAYYLLSWFFVIQYNRRPSHNTFLAQVAPFFQQTQAPNIVRATTCLVFANRAGKPIPGKVDQFGHTSLIFSPQAQFSTPKCYPTFSNGGVRFRNSDTLAGYHDIFFREAGACVHSFAQVNPGSLDYGPAGNSHAVISPYVFGIDGHVDQRAPSGPVPASVKWVNDQLDDIRKLSTLYPTAPLAMPSNSAHEQNVLGLRVQSGRALENSINLATYRAPPANGQPLPERVADEWNESELQAFEHLLHSLNILSIGSPPASFGVEEAHASISIEGVQLDFVAVRGIRHEDCLKHRNDLLGPPRKQTLLVSRDYNNTEWSPRERSILETENKQLGAERNITDPASNLLHIGFDNLLRVFRQTQTSANISGAINAIINS